MLVLTSKPNDEIGILDGLITVKVLEITGNQVRLGFDAPQEVTILRADAIKREP